MKHQHGNRTTKVGLSEYVHEPKLCSTTNMVNTRNQFVYRCKSPNSTKLHIIHQTHCQLTVNLELE